MQLIKTFVFKNSYFKLVLVLFLLQLLVLHLKIESKEKKEKSLSMDKSTIIPLGQGSFEIKQFWDSLQLNGYSGPGGLMNFKFEEDAQIYIEGSIYDWKILTNHITHGEQ